MKMKMSGKTIGIPAGIAIGTLISLVISIAGAAVSAWLVSSEKIGEGGTMYAAMIIVALAAAMGAWFSTSMIKRLRLQMCMLSGTCYFLALLAMTALFFEGQYQGIGTIAVVILCGCAVIAFLPTKNGQFKRKRKKGYR
jgi:putative membrane protein (TIGR04086 family)